MILTVSRHLGICLLSDGGLVSPIIRSFVRYRSHAFGYNSAFFRPRRQPSATASVVCARGGAHTANGFEARHLRRRRPCGRGAHVAAHASEARGASALSCRPFTCTACACTRHARGICVHCMHARHACAANSLWATVARMCTPGNRRARGGCGRRGYGTRRCA